MRCVLKSLAELVGRYDALLCDVWGVVHDGRAALAGPCSALERWRETGAPVVLISNSPRLSDDVATQMDGLGVPRRAWSALVTSGDVTRSILARLAPGPAFAIGPKRDRPLYDGLGLGFAPLETAAFISCTGLFDDERETPEDYRALLERAAARKLPMVCANPDRIVQRGDRLVWCAGALAELYEALGGSVEMAGKPHAPIYRACLERAAALAGARLAAARALAIGDGIATDMAGAADQGLDALFIARGIHAAETLTPEGEVDIASAEALLARAGISARFVMAELAW